MKSNNFLFKKRLLMVAIVAKWSECIISVIFKSAWCLSSEFELTESITGHN